MSIIKEKITAHQFEVKRSRFPGSPTNPIVVGIRGQYPGKLKFNGNAKDQFNDTLVLLYQNANGQKYVREFPTTTDPGLVDWEPDSSSFLYPTPSVTLSAQYDQAQSSLEADSDKAVKPSKKFPYYYYRKGLHRGAYHALTMASLNYRVHEHRNGEPTYTRIGSAHNIHAARGSGSIEFENPAAHVANNSAGCQAIYGQQNYYAWVRAVYSLSQQKITDYFLFDGKEVEQMTGISATKEGDLKIRVTVPAELRESWDKEWKDLAPLPFYNRPASKESETINLANNLH